jgi:hypothetical protein
LQHNDLRPPPPLPLTALPGLASCPFLPPSLRRKSFHTFHFQSPPLPPRQDDTLALA